MGHILKCLNEHIKDMKYREDELRQEISIKNAELKLLEKERINLEIRIDNWAQENSEAQRHELGQKDV